MKPLNMIKYMKPVDSVVGYKRGPDIRAFSLNDTVTASTVQELTDTIRYLNSEQKIALSDTAQSERTIYIHV